MAKRKRKPQQPQVPEVVKENPITIVSPVEEILTGIQKADSKEELAQLEEIFNLSIAKKEMTRVAKQDELLDALLAQAEKRITTKPGELSHKEILDYYNTFSSMVNRAAEKNKTSDENSPLNITNTHNEITVNMPENNSLTRESQNKVLDAVKSIIAQANQPVQEEVIEDKEGSEVND